MAYVNPTSHNSPGGNWVNRDNAIDGSSSTFAYDTQFEDEVGTTYEALHNSIYCSGVKVRLQSYNDVDNDWSNDISYIIKVYNGSSWETIKEGNLTSSNELYSAEIDLDENKYIEKISIQFTNNSVSKPAREHLYYLQFISTPHPPDVTTTTPVTTKDHESATLEGEVTDAYEQEITERGFEYKKGEDGEVQTVSEEDDDFGTGTFDLEITGLEPNTEYYYRAYAVNEGGTGYGDWESFTTDKTTPTVVTNAVTEIDTDSATANGDITSTGGEDCSERGFEYGLTKVATWTVTDDVGGYIEGAFTKALSSLETNTIYWIRAYAVNSVGTSYGEWVQFQTAVTGTTPSNTRITLTGDVSGYVAEMHAAETDLDVDYEAYFVLATDLSESNSLVFYKRLLDLDSYFRKETSGTMTISIKCDHEDEWRELGDISLTGDDDIVLPHLAPDELGKHFLIKFAGENAFRYLGTIFRFIVQGER